MSQAYNLIAPLDESQLCNLKVGDKVLLNGIIYTARDAAHKRIVEALENKQTLPFPLKNQIIYYVGPAPAKPGTVIGSAGPTTSCRMDPYTPILLEKGLKAMIGKGPRSDEIVESIKKNRAIYFVTVGGAAAVTAQAIKKVQVIAYSGLGPEAIHKLTIKNLPAFVAIDIFGNNIFNQK